jgi:hypothetical protein
MEDVQLMVGLAMRLIILGMNLGAQILCLKLFSAMLLFVRDSAWVYEKSYLSSSSFSMYLPLWMGSFIRLT